MTLLKSYATLALAAFTFTLGFPNLIGILIPFSSIIGAFLLIFELVKPSSTKTRFFKFLFFNTIITYLSFYWITATLQEFGELPFIIAAGANFLYAFIFSPQFWFFILFLHVLDKKNITFKRICSNHFLTFSLSAALTIIEYFIPQQFPVMLGHPWITVSPYLGFAPIFGIPIFSFMSYLLIFESLKWLLTKSVSKINIISIIGFIILNPLLTIEESEEKTNMNIRMVQANISNFLKVDSEKGTYASTNQVLNQYNTLSLKPFTKNHKKIDLIIWPETAYPFAINTNAEDLTRTVIPFIFRNITKFHNTELLFGGYDHFKDNPDKSYFMTEYNSALLIDSSGDLKDIYHKKILIPFGETLPLGPLNKWASSMVPSMAFFATGETSTLFKTNSSSTFSASICYEILRPEFLRDYLNELDRRPQFMVNLTNDSWYGNTVEPEQHLFLARWRALEFNLPLLRSTNTGITVELDRFGQEVNRLDSGKTGNLDLEFKFQKNTPATLFQRFGFLLMMFLWIGYLILHLLLIKLKK